MANGPKYGTVEPGRVEQPPAAAGGVRLGGRSGVRPGLWRRPRRLAIGPGRRHPGRRPGGVRARLRPPARRHGGRAGRGVAGATRCCWRSPGFGRRNIGVARARRFGRFRGRHAGGRAQAVAGAQGGRPPDWIVYGTKLSPAAVIEALNRHERRRARLLRASCFRFPRRYCLGQ